jgi:hypothetical protein
MSEETTQAQQVAMWLLSVLRTANIPMGEARNAVMVEGWLQQMAEGEITTQEQVKEAA